MPTAQPSTPKKTIVKKIRKGALLPRLLIFLLLIG